MVQVLSPGVQHHQYANDRPQPLRVGGHLAPRSGRAAHQQVIPDSGVGERQLADFGRQGEHHMMVLDRQQVLRLLIEPASAGQGLALGTVAGGGGGRAGEGGGGGGGGGAGGEGGDARRGVKGGR